MYGDEYDSDIQIFHRLFDPLRQKYKEAKIDFPKTFLVIDSGYTSVELVDELAKPEYDIYTVGTIVGTKKLFQAFTEKTQIGYNCTVYERLADDLGDDVYVEQCNIKKKKGKVVLTLIFLYCSAIGI